MRDQQSPSLTRRSDGPPLKKEKQSRNSYRIRLWDRQISSADGVFAPSKDRQRIAEQICAPSYERGSVSKYTEIKNATAEVVGVRLLKKRSTARAHEAIRDLIVANPTLSYEQIAGLLGCSRWLVYRVAVEFGVRRPRGAGSPARQQKQGGLPK
jgi:hypothetical protein